MAELHEQKCEPCEGGIPPLSREAAEKNLEKLDGWQMPEDLLIKKFNFKDFKEAMAFVNKIAEIAEQEGHHPVMLVNYNEVCISLITHAINGLSVNDFILAAKIDQIK